MPGPPCGGENIRGAAGGGAPIAGAPGIGPPGRGPPGVTNHQLEAAMLKSSLRDGIHVLRTATTAHTANLVSYLYDELCKGTLFTSTTREYASCVRSKRKRSNLDGETTWRVMLAQLPGMSDVKAKVVAEAYPTMTALARATKTELAELRVAGAGAAKARRLGPVLAARLVALQ